MKHTIHTKVATRGEEGFYFFCVYPKLLLDSGCMTEAKNREKFVLGYAPRLFRTMGGGSKPLSPGSNASPAGNRGSYLETSEVMGSEWEGGKE